MAVQSDRLPRGPESGPGLAVPRSRQLYENTSSHFCIGVLGVAPCHCTMILLTIPIERCGTQKYGYVPVSSGLEVCHSVHVVCPWGVTVWDTVAVFRHRTVVPGAIRSSGAENAKSTRVISTTLSVPSPGSMGSWCSLHAATSSVIKAASPRPVLPRGVYGTLEYFITYLGTLAAELPLTTTLPVIKAWGVQWNGNGPGLGNVSV